MVGSQEIKKVRVEFWGADWLNTKFETQKVSFHALIAKKGYPLGYVTGVGMDDDAVDSTVALVLLGSASWLEVVSFLKT